MSEHSRMNPNSGMHSAIQHSSGVHSAIQHSSSIHSAIQPHNSGLQSAISTNLNLDNFRFSDIDNQ